MFTLLRGESRRGSSPVCFVGLYDLFRRALTTATQIFYGKDAQAEGGRCFTRGTFYYSAQYLTSDNTDAMERRRSISNMARVSRPSYSHPWVPMSPHHPNHQSGRVTDLKTAGCSDERVFGYELDLTAFRRTRKENHQRTDQHV